VVLVALPTVDVKDVKTPLVARMVSGIIFSKLPYRS
jgi:hypothetical protein